MSQRFKDLDRLLFVATSKGLNRRELEVVDRRATDCTRHVLFTHDVQGTRQASGAQGVLARR
jgi:hypothetical protein